MSSPRLFDFRVPQHDLIVQVRHDGRSLARVELRGCRHTPGPYDPRSAFERRIAVALQRYFAGKRVVFRLPLAGGCGTPFQRAVWRALREIPYGEVRTYGEVARTIGKPGAARAVGNACGANPWPIIVPCHRVVASDGLGGYSAGPRWKRLLLTIERPA